MTRRQSIWSLAALSAAALIWASHNVAGPGSRKRCTPWRESNPHEPGLVLYIPILLRYKAPICTQRSAASRSGGLVSRRLLSAVLLGAQRAAPLRRRHLALGPALTCALGVPYLGEKLTGRAVAGLIIALTSATAWLARARLR